MKGTSIIILMGLILMAGGLFSLYKADARIGATTDATPGGESIRKIDLVLPGTHSPLITLEWMGEERLAVFLTDETERKELYRENREEGSGILPDPLIYGSPDGNRQGPYKLEWSKDILNRLNRMKLYYRTSPIRQYLIFYKSGMGESGELMSLRVLDGQGRYLYSLSPDVP